MIKFLWLFILPLACAANTWVVKLKDYDQSHVEGFALMHNLEYVGDLPHLKGYYAFRTTDRTDSQSFNSNLVNEPESNASWMEQQHDRKQYKRTLDPQWGSEWHLKGGAAGVHAEEAWNAPYNRRGSSSITVAIVDDGLQSDHPDLKDRFDADNSWDYNQHKHTVTPYSDDGHGTSASGVCCATADNHQCGAGVCPLCRVAGIRLIAGSVNDYTESLALAHNDLPIYSCSWGPADSADSLEGPGNLLKRTFEQQTSHGRGGKGAIFVWAGGNGRTNKDNGNYDGYANNRHTLAIGALNDNGKVSYYSEPCACLIAVAPSSGRNGHRGISTTDLMGSSGYSSGSCTSRFGGTSSAAPLAAGIVALLLQERPKLTWRDVQHVIASGATKVDTGSSGWSHNARGYKHHHDYGFGNMVIPALLDAAKTHTLVSHQKHCSSGRKNVHASIPYSTGVGLGSCKLSFVEHVELYLSWSHARHGQVTVRLTSPEHVTSELANARGDSHRGNKAWTFTSMRHWGEQIKQGKRWQIDVGDSKPNDRYKGSVLWYELNVYGY